MCVKQETHNFAVRKAEEYLKRVNLLEQQIESSKKTIESIMDDVQYHYGFGKVYTRLQLLLNSLDTTEITPGVYRTRNGKKVTIHEIKLHNDNNEFVTFPAKGSIWNKEDKMGINPEYSIWTLTGRHGVLGDSSLDLIERIDNV